MAYYAINVMQCKAMQSSHDMMRCNATLHRVLISLHRSYRHAENFHTASSIRSFISNQINTGVLLRLKDRYYQSTGQQVKYIPVYSLDYFVLYT